MIAILAVFVLAFAIGYMLGFRDGKEYGIHCTKTFLNELYGKFGSVDTSVTSETHHEKN